MNVYGKEISIRGRLVRIARLADEGFDFVEDPEATARFIRESGTRVDLFSFFPRLPNVTPDERYLMDWDNVAALPISTYENWWSKQIDSKTRNMVRRAEKKGIVVREVEFNDDIVKGIWEIHNECPFRQGRPFQHYGEDMEATRKMSSTFLSSSIFIGAFLEEQMIGFIKLTVDDARSQAGVMHIISMMKHRDKAPTNALVAQAVQSCSSRNVPYIVYSKFAYLRRQRDSLSDFKTNNGFQRIDLPKYYLPLTPWGSLAHRLGLHKSMLDRVPEPVQVKYRELRSAWYNARYKQNSAA